MTPATVPAIAPGGARPIDIALLASVFVVAACGLLYELAAGALASYVLGDSVLQFSTIIGTYLFAMGVGAWRCWSSKGRICKTTPMRSKNAKWANCGHAPVAGRRCLAG